MVNYYIDRELSVGEREGAKNREASFGHEMRLRDVKE